MSRSAILSTTPDLPADTPDTIVEDVLAAAWHVIDTLPNRSPLRPPLVHAVWALEDAADAGACVAVALPVVVGLLTVTV